MLHMMKRSRFTKMAHHTFRGDPCDMSKMFDCIIYHIYMTLYDKIKAIYPTFLFDVFNRSGLWLKPTTEKIKF